MNISTYILKQNKFLKSLAPYTTDYFVCISLIDLWTLNFSSKYFLIFLNIIYFSIKNYSMQMLYILSIKKKGRKDSYFIREDEGIRHFQIKVEEQ